MSFRYTLDAVEQQTNMMKLVTDWETRLKYLMTVHKIWEHGIHKLNKYIEKANRLFGEAYRVVLRKLEVGDMIFSGLVYEASSGQAWRLVMKYFLQSLTRFR